MEERTGTAEKVAQIGLWSGSTGLQTVYAKGGAIHNLKGKVAECHRAFVFSADLLAESAVTPWRTLCDDAAIDPPHADAIIESMLSQQGEFDILIVCDGARCLPLFCDMRRRESKTRK